MNEIFQYSQEQIASQEQGERKPSFQYHLSNMSLPIQIAMGDRSQLIHFLEDSGEFEHLHLVPWQPYINVSQELTANEYRDSNGNPIVGSADQGFRAEGKGKKAGVAGIVPTAIDIFKQNPVYPLFALALTTHMEDCTEILMSLRSKLGDTFPISIYPQSESFNTLEKRQSLDGSVLVQINKMLLEHWKITNADQLQKTLKENHVSAILDIKHLQELGVIDILSQREKSQDTSISFERAIDNFFDLNLLGSIPIIHYSDKRSDLHDRTYLPGNNQEIIVRHIGKKTKESPTKYIVVIEPSPIDIARDSGSGPLPFLRTTHHAEALAKMKKEVNGWLLAG